MSQAVHKLNPLENLIGQIVIGLAVAIFTGLFFVASYSYEVHFLTYVGVPDSIASQSAELDMMVYFTLLPIIGACVLFFCILIQCDLTSTRFRKMIRNTLLRVALLLVSTVTLIVPIWLPSEGLWLKVSSVALFIGGITFICLTVPFIIGCVRFIVSRDKTLISIGLVMVGLTVILIELLPLAVSNFAKYRAASFRPDKVVIHSEEYDLIRYYNSKILLKKGGHFFIITTDEAGLIEYSGF